MPGKVVAGCVTMPAQAAYMAVARAGHISTNNHYWQFEKLGYSFRHWMLGSATKMSA
jgi:hypothetical protein